MSNPPIAPQSRKTQRQITVFCHSHPIIYDIHRVIPIQRIVHQSRIRNRFFRQNAVHPVYIDRTRTEMLFPIYVRKMNQSPHFLFSERGRGQIYRPKRSLIVQLQETGIRSAFDRHQSIRTEIRIPYINLVIIVRTRLKQNRSRQQAGQHP